MTLTEFATKIGFEPADASLIGTYAPTPPPPHIASAFSSGSVSPGMHALYLACMLAAARERDFISHSISHEIYLDTYRDIAIWAKNYQADTGTLGLGELDWIGLALAGRLFRIGRLQFELPPEAGAFCCDASPSSSYTLELHIPQGEPLSPIACDASFAAAKSFFPTLGLAINGFHCHSWLLHPNLADVLPPSANILAFGRRFSILSVDNNDEQYIERIFGKKYVGKLPNTARFPTESSLQKHVIAYMLRGGVLGSAEGIIIPAD